MAQWDCKYHCWDSESPVRSLLRLQDLQSLALPPSRQSRGMTVTVVCRHAFHLAVVWPINAFPVSWYIDFSTTGTLIIWYLRYFYLSAATALCGAVSLLGLGIFRKKYQCEFQYVVYTIYPNKYFAYPRIVIFYHSVWNPFGAKRQALQRLRTFLLVPWWVWAVPWCGPTP